MIVARSQIKEIAKEAGINNVSEDFIDRLEKKVKQITEEACARAKENGRKTLMGKDV